MGDRFGKGFAGTWRPVTGSGTSRHARAFIAPPAPDGDTQTPEPPLIRPLPLCLVPGDRETPVDYLSRLSFRNGRDGLRKIATDFGIALAPLVHGDAEQVGLVARLGSVDAACLARSALRQVENGRRTTYRGQVLHHSMSTHARIRFCPACLLDDVGRGTGRIESRPWRRAEWLLPDLGACPDHSLALVELAPSETRDWAALDFSASVARILPRLDDEMRRAATRSVTSMEGYVLRRLSGGAAVSDGESWLDGFPLYAVIRLCEVVGAVALEGVNAPERKGRGETSRTRQAAGYAVAVDGPLAFRSFLSEIKRLDLDPRAQRGPAAVFGRLFVWLSRAPHDPAYDPFRYALRDVCVATMPIGTVAEGLFGLPVPTRRLHSVKSAANEFGIHPESLRKILFARGVVGPEQGDLPNNRVTFDAAANEHFLRDLGASLTQDAAARHLGIHHRVLQSFTEEGILVPWVGGNRAESSKHYFRKADLDGFVDRLTADASAELSMDPSLYDIPAAARRACRSQSEVARMLLSGALAKVGRRIGAMGYMSVLVDPAEVRSKSRTTASPGISVSDARDETGISKRALWALLREGVIASTPGQNPVTGGAQAFLDRDDLARFVERYSTLSEIAAGLSAPSKVVKNRLADTGVEPAAISRGKDAIFYERCALPPLQTLDLAPKVWKRKVRP